MNWQSKILFTYLITLFRSYKIMQYRNLVTPIYISKPFIRLTTNDVCRVNEISVTLFARLKRHFFNDVTDYRFIYWQSIATRIRHLDGIDLHKKWQSEKNKKSQSGEFIRSCYDEFKDSYQKMFDELNWEMANVY